MRQCMDAENLHRRLKKIQKTLKPANLKKSFNKRLVKFCSEDIFKISKKCLGEEGK